jgi:spore germination protein KB
MEATVVLFLVGSSLVTGGSTRAKQDTWFCIVAAMILVIPMVWVHSEILNLYPGRNYFENIICAAGRPAGTVICVLITLYALVLGAVVLRNFSEFIHLVNMVETPIIMIAVSVMVVVIYTLSNGLYVLARISKLMLLLLVVSVTVTIVLAYQNMDASHLKPVLQSRPADLLRGIVSSFSTPYCEIILCAPMFGAMSRNAKIFPTFLKGVFFAFLILLAANIRNTLVLGYLDTTVNYSSYEAVSVIQIGEFFTRVEVLIGITLLLAGFVKSGVILFSTCEGLRKAAGYRDYEPIVVPVGVLTLTAVPLISSNVSELSWMIEHLPFYALPVQVLLPVLVLVIGKGKKKLKQRKAPRQGQIPKKTKSA